MRACVQSNPRKARESGVGTKSEQQEVRRVDLLLELERLVHVAVLGADARAPASSARSTRLLKHFVVLALPSPSADEPAALVRRAFRLTLSVPSLAQLKPSIIVRFCSLYSTLLYFLIIASVLYQCTFTCSVLVKRTIQSTCKYSTLLKGYNLCKLRVCCRL